MAPCAPPGSATDRTVRNNTINARNQNSYSALAALTILCVILFALDLQPVLDRFIRFSDQSDDAHDQKSDAQSGGYEAGDHVHEDLK